MGFSKQEYWSGVPLPSPKETWDKNIWVLYPTSPSSTRLETKISGSYIQHPHLPPVCLWITSNQMYSLPSILHPVSWKQILKSHFLFLNLSLLFGSQSLPGPGLPHPVAPTSPPYTPTTELVLFLALVHAATNTYSSDSQGRDAMSRTNWKSLRMDSENFLGDCKVQPVRVQMLSSGWRVKS